MVTIINKQQNRLYKSSWKQPTVPFSTSKKQVPRLGAVEKLLIKKYGDQVFFGINVKLTRSL